MKKLVAVFVMIAAIVSLGALAFAGSTPADGKWLGISDADDHGYATALVTIEKGRIKAVELTEYTELAVVKDFDKYPYKKSKEAHDILTKAFVTASGPKVDNVTGATHSTHKYTQAVERALAKASGTTGGKTYFDGVFMGKSSVNTKNGNYYEVVWVTIKNDKITDIRFERVLADGKFLKLEDYKFPLAEKRQIMKERVIAKQSTDVDVVTGATGATAMWKEAINDALKNAKTK